MLWTLEATSSGKFILSEFFRHLLCDIVQGASELFSYEVEPILFYLHLRVVVKINLI